MLKLSLSLLLTAICALFGLGVLLDQLADDSSEPLATIERRVLHHIAKQLQNTHPSHWAQEVAQQSQQWQLPVQLRQRSELALPTPIQQQLASTDGVLLSDGQQLSLYRAVDDTYLLQLALPDNAAPHPIDLWLTLSLYAGFCLSMWLWAWPLMRRLWRLHQTAWQFGQGDLAARLPPSRWSYIPQIETSFNQMAQRIEQLMSDNKLLSQSLSHDLRTPIACLRFGLEAAQDEADSQQKDVYLQRMEADLSRMEAMISAVLQYASLDRQRWHSHKSEIDFALLCQQQLEQCRPLADERALQISASYPQEPLLMTGHAHWLHCAVQNLLQNALRHATHQVELRLTLQQQWLCLTIKDDGVGIAQSDAERIFSPFVQLEQRNAENFGLGLAIVKKVVDWHHGSIRVSQFAPAGAVFELSLPLTPQVSQQL